MSECLKDPLDFQAFKYSKLKHSWYRDSILHYRTRLQGLHSSLCVFQTLKIQTFNLTGDTLWLRTDPHLTPLQICGITDNISYGDFGQVRKQINSHTKTSLKYLSCAEAMCLQRLRSRMISPSNFRARSSTTFFATPSASQTWRAANMEQRGSSALASRWRARRASSCVVELKKRAYVPPSVDSVVQKLRLG